jgi:hypothetical protein
MPGWKIAFISNTGVTESYGSNVSRVDAIALPDGSAGQWVIEMFKDTPKPVSEDGRTGFAYPFQAIVVTAANVEAAPDIDLKSAAKLVALDPVLGALQTALAAAKAKVTKKYDKLSIASDNRQGVIYWNFRFYDLKTQDIVAAIQVSGDGKTVLQSK